MGRIIRREFLGNRVIVLLLSLSVIGIPWAILHVLEGLVTIEEELDDPTGFLEPMPAVDLLKRHENAGGQLC